MNVAVVGSGYVGTTVAACLAELGHQVTAIDTNSEVVEAINEGEAPIHEPGLERRIAEHAGERLVASERFAPVADAAVTLLCLPTPTGPDGRQDTSTLTAASEAVGSALGPDPGGHVVAVKSTVLPGTTHETVGSVLAEHAAGELGVDVHLAANPEFLQMGSAVEDFEEPDKVVIGTDERAPVETLRDLYEPIVESGETALVETGIREAELIKYANNAFLASKVSLVNELGNIAKEYGADAYEVLEAVGLDERISPRFMRSGLGWGGSCFPKDVDALRAGAREQGYEPQLLDAAVAVNDRQPERLVELLADHVDLQGARIAVLGLAFKPHTDDVRGSRGLAVVDRLVERGADVVAYDPVANEEARERRPDIAYAPTAADALAGADGAAIATEWPEFADLEFGEMQRRVLVDGRRVDIDRSQLDVYEGVTW